MTGLPVPAALAGAVDIGATKTLLAVVPLPLTTWPARGREARGDATVETGLAAAGALRLPTGPDPALLADRAAEALRALAAGAGAPLAAVGVAAPGPLDAGAGVIEHSPNQGRAWRGTRITALLAERLAVPVALDDDARLGALGEALLGAGRGADPLVYVTVSSGIGSGIVSGGRMLRGAHGLAGEVGHLVVDPDGPRCACGRRGDVESYAGGAALARRARRAWPSGRLADGSAAPRDAAGIFRAARAGDPLARGIVAEAAEALGRGLAALATAIDPERIVVGGSLALSQGALVRRAVAIARRRCLAETGRRLVVVQSALGETSVLAGAALLAAELAGGAPPPGP